MKKFLLTCMVAMGLSASAQIVTNEGFENATIPAAWTSTTFYYTDAAGFPCTGTGAARTNVYSFVPTADIVYSSTASNGQAISLSFKYNAKPYNSTASVNGNFIVEYSVNGGTAYTQIGNQVDLTAASTSCVQFSGNIAAALVPVGSNFKFRIRVNNVGSGDWYLTVDDVALTQTASCYAPINLTSTGATANSSTISWTAPTQAPASSYQVYYSTTNTAPTSTTVLNATNSLTTSTTSATISSLAANTIYYVWVRSVCSTTDQSAWAGPLSVFTGTCLPTGGSSSTSYYLNSVTTNGASTNLSYTATAYSAYVNNSTSVTSYPGGSFTYALAAAGGSTYYYYIWADLNNDLDFNDAGETIVATTTYSATNSGTITLPTTLATGTYRMRTAVSYSGVITPCGPAPYGNYVDFNLIVSAVPTCLPPSAVTASAVTSNSATLTWTASSTVPANGYDLYYSTSSTQPTGTTTPNFTNITATTKNITGLASSSVYYVWVRSHCTTTDISSWVMGQSFTTACVSINTISENFDTTSTTGNVLPLCWSKIVTGSANAYVQSGSTISTPNTMYIYAGAATETCIVKLPQISNLNSGNYAIAFKGRANFTLGGVVQIGYMTDASNASTFVVLGTYTSTSTTVIDNFFLPITGVPAGVTTLALKHTGSPAYSVLIDDFRYDLTSVLSTTETSNIKKENIKVYPNPFTDVLNISDVEKVKSISVNDISGRLVKTFDNPTSSLQLGELNAGLYIVTLNMKDGSKQTIKAIKK